jgi:hypothetical protein
MTNKTKNWLLILGFILALYICYQLAFSKTFEMRKSYKSLSNEEVLFKNTPKQLSLLKQKEKYYDSLLTRYQLGGSSIQNNLLKTLNSEAEKLNLKVINFSEPHTYKENDLTIKIYQFSLEGNYNNIIQSIHTLEQQTKFGEIINLHFEKKKNFRTGQNYLQAHILLKSFG